MDRDGTMNGTRLEKVLRPSCLVAGCNLQGRPTVSSRRARFAADLARQASRRCGASNPNPAGRSPPPSDASATLRPMADQTEPERRFRAALAVERDDAAAARSARVGRCPTRPTSSSSAAATPGSTPLAELARRGVAVTLLEARDARLGRLDAQRRHRPRGLQVGPARARRSATARRPARRSTARRSTATRPSSG